MSALADDAPRGFVPRHELYKALAEIDRLREEVTNQREELAHQRQRFVTIAAAARRLKLREVLGLSATLSAMLIELIDHEAVTNEELLRVQEPFRNESSDPNPANITRVNICRMRRRFEQLGGSRDAIKSIWNGGYKLSDEGRAWLQQRAPEAFKGAR